MELHDLTAVQQAKSIRSGELSAVELTKHYLQRSHELSDTVGAFVEFTDDIVESMTDGDTVRVPDALIQPIAANDVAAEVVRVALSAPLNRFEDIGGPERLSFAELARRKAPDKTVIVDPTARYFGTTLAETSLVVSP